jgi:hypothetical protein
MGVAGYAAGMDEARRIQLEIFRRWTPEERVQRGLELSALCFAARDERLRRQHPDASEEELRWIRVREVLGLAPDAPLP